MAILLKREHRLPTLLLSNERGRASSRGNTVFTLQVGDETIDRLTVPSAELNLPPDLRSLLEYEYRDPDYRIPADTISRIKGQIAAKLAPSAPLWLLFDTPSGFLPLVPWERLLQPGLGVPLLRIPNFLVNPSSDGDTLNVVLIASSPVTEPAISHDEMLLRILRPLVDVVHRRVRADVFVDQAAYSMVQTRFEQEGLADRIEVHDPARSAERGAASDDVWLNWISRSLAGRAIDLVYFVAHGCLAPTDGLLMLAESPTRNRDREIFIGAQQIDAFLTMVGAWSVGFSMPPQNYSGSGIRLLADQLGQRRPGPILVHDVAVDPQGADLSGAFEFLLNRSGHAPSSAALSIACHPDYLQSDIRMSYDVTSGSEPIDRLTLSGSQAASLLQSNDAASSWIAKSQRVLEKAAAEVTRNATFEDQPSATSQGYEDTLRYVSEVLARHAVAPQTGTDEEGAA